MSANPKNIILYVNNLPSTTVASIRLYEEREDKDFRIMVIRDSRQQKPASLTGYDMLLEVDFSKPQKIAEALLPYQDQFVAVSCRSDVNINRFIKVIPHVPYLRTPSTDSLRWATDKYEMRKRFRLFDAKNTPKFQCMTKNSKVERQKTIEKVGFPLVIKPTNLASSRFVSICYHEEEFEKALSMIFRKLKKAYADDKRPEEPRVIAEEYMEGDMYSIDSYVDGRGNVYHCPLVRVKTGRDIGHDDFYNYLPAYPDSA